MIQLQNWKRFFACFVAISLSTIAFAGELTLASDKRWIVIASRPTIEEARAIADYYRTYFKSTSIFLSENGWYAITVGHVSYPSGKTKLQRLIIDGQIPSDSFLSTGKKFSRVVSSEQENSYAQSSNLRSPQQSRQPEPVSPQPRYDTPHASTSGWTPNETEIRNALQREFDRRMAGVDALAAQCENLGDTQNPIAAVMCLMSGGGMVTSQTFGAQVNSIALDECVRSNEGVAYCRYRSNTTMSGAGVVRPMANFANALGGIAGWTYSSFINHGGTWHLQKHYDHCSWGGGGINCRWTERR